MPITVVITRDDVGAPSTREVYETGVKYQVEGGDLMIYSARPQLLGTYGSGNWMSVYMGDAVEVISTKPDEDSDDDSGFGGDSFSFDSDDTSSTDDTGSTDDTSFDSDDTTSTDDTSSTDDGMSLDDASSTDDTSSTDDSISPDDESSDSATV
jgi:hypothetical protein